MTDETQVAERDYMTSIIEGARQSRGIDDRDTIMRSPPGMQSQRTQQTVVGGVVPATSISARFETKSVRIDNFTNQWLRMGEDFDYIPPGVIGYIRNVRGKSTITVVAEVPLIAGMAQAAPTSGESYFVTLYDKPQMPANGYDPGYLAYISVPATITNNLAINPPTSWPGGWQVMEWESQYGCSATVGTRNVRVEINDGIGTAPLTQRTEPTGFVANSSNRIMVFPGDGEDWVNHALGGAFGTEYFVGWPVAPIIMQDGFLEILDIHNIAANDVIVSRVVLKRLPVAHL